MNRRYASLGILFALCAALLLPGVALGQEVRASRAPTPPINLHVTSIVESVGNGYWLINFAWTPPDAISKIAATNGRGLVVPLGVGGSTYFVAVGQSEWGCLSVVAYDDTSASPWTPYVCGEGPGAPNMPTNVRQTTATSSSVSFDWGGVYSSTGIAVSNGSVVTALAPGATSYTLTGVAGGSWNCLSVAAYTANGASAWTPWACGFAIPATPSNVHVTGHDTSSVSFAWTDHDAMWGIAVSTGTTSTILSPGGSTYTQSGMTTGSWSCVAVASYNISGTSPWSPWTCGQAVGFTINNPKKP